MAETMLHVTNGDSVSGTLAEAGVPGRILTWADVLWEGPVPATDDEAAFRAARAEFLAEAGYADHAETLARMRDRDAVLAGHADDDEVVLWFEHDLYDQLILIRLLSLFARRDLGRTRLSLICIGSYPGVPGFRGLGELTASQLASLVDTRQDVTPAQLSLATAAWSAFTAPDPTEIERLLRGDTTALPFLAGALLRHLAEFPSVRHGLSRTEELALQAAAELGPAKAIRLFLVSQDKEERPFLGDTSFFRVLRHLASGPQPLLEISEDAQADIGQGLVTLTVCGWRVLAGEEDWARIRGVDRWHGSVHLKGSEPRWRWDGHGLVATA